MTGFFMRASLNRAATRNRLRDGAFLAQILHTGPTHFRSAALRSAPQKQSERNSALPRTLSMRKLLVRTGKAQLSVLLIMTAFFVPLNSSQADTLTEEEQALVDKGAIMQMYKPDEHSRHFIAHIDSVTDPRTGRARNVPNKSQTVVCFVFGIEDAEPAREQGRSMAEFYYSSSQAHEFLFAQGWDKYRDRFFTRCYVQEGEAAYDKAVETQQKHVDESSSS